MVSARVPFHKGKDRIKNWNNCCVQNRIKNGLVGAVFYNYLEIIGFF